VTVSVDALGVSEPRLVLARGFVMELGPTGVVVGVDHGVSDDGILKRVAGEVAFRIDRDEMFAGTRQKESRRPPQTSTVTDPTPGHRLKPLLVALRIKHLREIITYPAHRLVLS